jgi:hypothetical protein
MPEITILGGGFLQKKQWAGYEKLIQFLGFLNPLKETEVGFFI